MWELNRRDGWNPFVAIGFYETVLIVSIAVVYLLGKWRIPGLIFLIVLLLHSGFWFWEFGSRFFFGGYAGPLAPTAGLCAGLAWFMYLRHSIGQSEV
jgi:hypothetical protein